jgi:hypothetical protein
LDLSTLVRADLGTGSASIARANPKEGGARLNEYELMFILPTNLDEETATSV